MSVCSYQVWNINSSGVITSDSGWLNATAAVNAGYEKTFSIDLNNDGMITGESYYQLASSSRGAITITEGRNPENNGKKYYFYSNPKKHIEKMGPRPPPKKTCLNKEREARKCIKSC